MTQFEQTTAVTVTTTITDIYTINLSPSKDSVNDVCVVEVQNAGNGTLNNFIIYLQDHPNGEFYSFLSGIHFDAASNTNMLFASDVGPHELPSGAKAHVHFRYNGVIAIKFSASTGSGTASVTLRGTLKAQ